MTAPVTFHTAQRLIRLAYKDAGLVQDGDEPNGEQYADGLSRLNDMVNLWQTQGLKLFLIHDVAVPLVVGQGSYTMSPTGDVAMTKPLRIIQAYNLDQNSIRRPLVCLSREEYTRLSQVTQTGQLNSYFVDKQADSLIVHFWLVPDAQAATGTAHVITETQASNIISLTDNDGFPVEWAMALRWGLADDLATGQPQAIMQRCEMKAAQYRMMLEDWDVEDASTSFAPDQRGLYATSSFR